MQILSYINLRLRQWLAMPLFVFLLQLYCTQALALTAPGTAIQNRAELTYVDAASGESVTVLSNQSVVSVGQYYNLSLVPDLSLPAQVGRIVQFPHRLTNTGNTADSYRIFTGTAFPANDPVALPEPAVSDLVLSDAAFSESALSEPVLSDTVLSGTAMSDSTQTDQRHSETLQNDSAQTLQNIVVYEDVNGNGLVDDGEPVVDTTRQLPPAETMNLVVRAIVPMNAEPGATLSFRLYAESLGNASLVQFVTDEIDVETGPVLVIAKETFPVCEVLLFPGDEVTHSIQVENTGSSAPNGVRQIRDGSVQTAVVVEQPVSEHFTYSGVENVSSAGADASVVVRLEGAADNSWIGAENWDGSSRVVSVGLWLESGDFDTAASAEFSFNLQVADSATDVSFYTSAATVDLNGDSLPEAESNNTCHR